MRGRREMQGAILFTAYSLCAMQATSLLLPSAAFLSAPPFFKGMPSAAQKCSPKDVLHISRPLFRTSRREIFKFAADADSGETRGEDEGRSMHSRPSQPMEAVSRQGEGEREDTAGSVGISFFPDPSRGLVVSAVAPYSAARMLGCQPGDILLRVDGISTRNKLPPEIFQYISGPISTPVVLKLKSQLGNEKMITLKRTKLHLNRQRQRKIGLGSACVLAGQYERALSYLERDLERAKGEGDEGTQAEALLALGRACEGLEREEEAMSFYEGALQTFRMASDSLGEVAAFEKLVALVWNRENGGKMLDKPLTGKDLRKQIAESSRKTPAIIRRKIPIGEELGRLRVRVECASATDAVQLQSALNNSHAPTGAIVRVRKSSKGMAVLGDCVEVSLSEEGLLVCDEESVERAGSVLLWLVSEANGGLLEFSSALSSDQRRLMHTACDNNTLVHASAGPPSCRVLVVAGPGGEGRVEEVVGDIERRWEDRRRSAREERVRMQSLKRQATSNIVRGPFVGIGFGALDQTFSFSRKGEERRSSLSSLFGEAGGGPVLMNATYFKDLMDAFRAPQKEPFPEVDSNHGYMNGQGGLLRKYVEEHWDYKKPQIDYWKMTK